MSGTLTEWIRANGHAVASFDLDAPLTDLEPLADLVGSARVVGLGESSHHVREFYQVRHRILRFLVERCGFTVFAVEAPFTGGAALNDWLRGGPGAIADVAREAIALSLGDAPEFHEAMHWLRAYQGTPVRYAGTDLPGALGSPLPALDAIAAYVETNDPGALPTLNRARELAGRFHDPSPMKALFGYPALAQAERDALTSALAVLVARMRRRAHRDLAAEAAHHLRGAWLIDQLHRAMAEEGIEISSTFRDVYLAESVQYQLDLDPGARIVLAAHNWHLKKAPEPHEGTELYPAGYHLAAELGAGYRAIGITSRGGRTAVASGDLTGDCPFEEGTLPPLEDAAIEAAFPGTAPWTIADLRGAPGTARYTRMRMADYFCDQPAADCFDAIACVTETNATVHKRPARSSGPGH